MVRWARCIGAAALEAVDREGGGGTSALEAMDGEGGGGTSALEAMDGGEDRACSGR